MTELNKAGACGPDLDCFYVGCEDHDWFDLGLSHSPTGLTMAVEKARAICNEMRTDHMKKQAGFRKPGSGDAPMTEASKTTIVYSPDFKDYFKGMPVDLYFYEILTKHNLLASAAADLPVEAASGSAVSGPATSNSSATTHQASKAGNRKGTDFDFAALTESPDSRQSGKRALDATTEANPVEARQRSPFYLKSPRGSGNTA